MLVLPAFSIGAVTLLAACGGSSGRNAAPTIQPARQYQLVGFQPQKPVPVGKPAQLSFKITIPSGATLTHYRTGAGPHTGVDLVIVRQGADAIIYTDTTVAKNGVAREDVTLPAPGRYRVIVDAYPNQANVPRNFQLFTHITATGNTAAPKLPTDTNTVTVDGYHFTIHGAQKLKAIQPTLLTVTVTDPNGRPAQMKPYREALAHAIFIRVPTLDYFHTHVCAPTFPAAPPSPVRHPSARQSAPAASNSTPSCHSPAPGGSSCSPPPTATPSPCPSPCTRAKNQHHPALRSPGTRPVHPVGLTEHARLLARTLGPNEACSCVPCARTRLRAGG